MGIIATQFATAFRDFVTDGVASSGAHEVIKEEVRAIGPIIEAALVTVSLGSVDVIKDTRANLDADLAHPADAVALVYGDATDANNDLYIKVGASGSGSWTLTTILHDVIAAAAAPAVALAEEWAENPEDDEITGNPGQFSAKHHSLKAAAQAATATTKAAEAVDAANRVGSASSSSIRFPDYNLQFLGQRGLLKQSRTNMPAILNAADTHVISCWRVPSEKTHQNRGYRLLGNAAGQPAQFQFGINGTNLSANRGNLYWSHRQNGGGGSTLSLLGPVPTSEHFVAKVSRTLSGADVIYALDAWRCDTGAKDAGTSQTNPAGVAGIAAGALSQTHWYIGYADAVAGEPTDASVIAAPNGAASGFECEFIGFYSGAITDANMEAIALGADPLTILSPAGFTYYRRFRGTDAVSLAPAAGSGDTTPAATVLGRIFPGGNVRRQGQTNFITLDRFRDGRVFGCRKGEESQPIPFVGSLGGVAYSFSLNVPKSASWLHREIKHEGSFVWGRIIRDDGSVHVPWTRGLRLVNAATEGLTWVERSRIGVGVKHVILAQSQISYTFGNGGGGVVWRALSRKSQVAPGGSMTAYMTDNAGFGGARPQIRIFGGEVTFADGIAAAIDEISSRAGCLVELVSMAQPGTDPLEWIKTAGTRLWSDDVAMVSFAGSEFSSVAWQWYSNQQSKGNLFGTDVLDPVIKGIGNFADTNWIGNGLFRNGISFGVTGFTRVTTSFAGPFDTDALAASSGIPQTRATARAWAAANGFAVGPTLIDMQIDSFGGPHPEGTIYGTVRLGLREAETCLRSLGYSALQDPTIGSPVFNGGKTTITLTATLPNIGRLRVDDEATYAANVQGFEISTNGGSTWSRSGFTAALGATPATRGKVILTKASGDWTAFAAGQVQVRYAWGGPLAYGTSVESSLLIRGLLYDGSNTEGGLGLPLLPLTPTAVV